MNRTVHCQTLSFLPVPWKGQRLRDFRLNIGARSCVMQGVWTTSHQCVFPFPPSSPPQPSSGGCLSVDYWGRCLTQIPWALTIALAVYGSLEETLAALQLSDEGFLSDSKQDRADVFQSSCPWELPSAINDESSTPFSPHQHVLYCFPEDPV